MNCEEFVSYLSEYIDNEMNEDLRLEAVEHLSTCHNCHVVLDSTQKLLLLSKETLVEELPKERKSALFDGLQKRLKSKQQ